MSKKSRKAVPEVPLSGTRETNAGGAKAPPVGATRHDPGRGR